MRQSSSRLNSMARNRRFATVHIQLHLNHPASRKRPYGRKGDALVRGGGVNKAGIVILIVGIVILIAGAGFAVSAQSSADSMPWYDRALFPEEYDSYIAAANAGWAMAGVGVILTIVGLVIAVAAGSKTPTQTTGQPGQAQPGQLQIGPFIPGSAHFCQFCGRQVAPEAAWCPGCGRKLA